MADILIRGMEMPQSCFFCKIYTHNGGNCLQLQKHVSTDRFSQERDKDCPLVEVPPHGDLIDRDELFPIYADLLDGGDVKAVIPRICIDLAHVIIPASEVDRDS